MDNPAVTRPAAQKLDADRDGQADNTDVPGKAINGSRKHVHNSKNDHGWRRIVRNFSPSWFSVTMGTGIVSNILIAIPWKADWLYYLSIIFFVLNVALFSAFFMISVARYTIWPEIWTVMIQDPVNSLFLGTIPMGFATIIRMFTSVCVPSWGGWAVWFAFVMWIVDSVVGVAVTVSLGILLMSASHQRSLDSITAAQLLPIAATIVAASIGSQLAGVIPDPQVALGTLLASYVMWGMGVPMALSVLVIYYQRLALHKMPPREVIVSAFLPLGPLGLGGYTVLYLGKVANGLFPTTGTIDPMAGRIAYVLGFFISLIMWAYGLIWFALALASIYKARPFPFNMGWWGFTFPLGVYSTSTILLGQELPSLFFRVLGTIFGTSVILLWVFIFLRTAMGAWNGKLFNAPCLANLKEHEPEARTLEDNEEMEKAADLATESRDDHTLSVHRERKGFGGNAGG
ncbi:Putative transporter protein SLAC1/Mae1/ Ssu1/TehA [Septoria linicola]|uniref:Transporter protein SLAC1/Mae1/ Ssu1/TehA n=1 Tax=Septoria linicola TaxID=215465 RepID=A0A9Q9APQ2_9PEZI|nr:Putative transporter protein SLAC1/Mae1/ Ssu1/TehA [Septoria linicola]